MKLAIRLQNHGKKNHPFWWIVVAPYRKNLRGRFTEHVGYWNPRQGATVDRQVVFNMPRVKYWMANGAIPTHRVHFFLAQWNVLPQPWYYKKTDEELEKLQFRTPQEQMSDKQKKRAEIKKKRQSYTHLAPMNFYKKEAKFRHQVAKPYYIKIMNMMKLADRQNEIIREILLRSQFQKITRINELSNVTTFSDSQELAGLRKELDTAKSELHLLDEQFVNGNPYQQSKVIQKINGLCNKILEVEKRQNRFYGRIKPKEAEFSDVMTQDILDKKIEYELVHKKIEKLDKDLEYYSNLNENVTLEEYADWIVKNSDISPEEALLHAQQEFIERGRTGDLMIRLELLNFDDEAEPQDYDFSEDQVYEGNKWAEPGIEYSAHSLSLAYLNAKNTVWPANRPVHPVPDTKTYIPEQYYEPITTYNLKLVSFDAIEPREQIQKFHQKKTKTGKIPEQQTKSSKKQTAKL